MNQLLETPPMQLETTRFGSLEVDHGAIVHFPLGLLGFERFARWIVIDSDAIAPMRWLQCVDAGDVALLVVEPQLFFADYTPTIGAEDRDFLQLSSEDELVVACVVVVPDDPALMTINLLGPLAFNAAKRVGKQLVLAESQFSARQRLIPDPTPADEPVPVG
jgi:flagellar assembly factor FliW